MSHVEVGPLTQYNSLTDKHLAGYFNNTKMRRHLRRSGLVKRNGEIVPDTVYRMKIAQKDHQKHVRDMLAQAIVHKTLDLERTRQVAVRRKLEEISKIELVRRVKAERHRKGDEDLIPFFTPRMKRQKQRPNKIRSADGSVAGDEEHSETDVPPLKLGEQEKLPDAESRERLAKQFPKEEIDSKHLYTLDSVSLREYAKVLERVERHKSSHPSPYVVGRPKSAKMASGRDSTAKRKKKSGTMVLHRAEPAMFHQSRLQSLVEVTMKFTGGAVVSAGRTDLDPQKEVIVEQQHCGGNTLYVFKEKLLPGKKFTFTSRRHRGYPFSLTLYIDGVKDSRLSSCCEYKHKPGAKLGGKMGHFVFVGAKGAAPCYKCQVEKGAIPVKEKKKKKVEEEEEEYNPSDDFEPSEHPEEEEVEEEEHEEKEEEEEKVDEEKPASPPAPMFPERRSSSSSNSSSSSKSSSLSKSSKSSEEPRVIHIPPKPENRKSNSEVNQDDSKQVNIIGYDSDHEDHKDDAEQVPVGDTQDSAGSDNILIDLDDDDFDVKSEQSEKSELSEISRNSESEGEFGYVITVFTGDELGAGTDANVSLNMIGTLGDSGRRKLENNSGDEIFDRNKVDEFHINCKDIGEIESLRVWTDSSGLMPDWKLDKVEVRNKQTGHVTVFPCFNWLTENFASRILIPEDPEPAPVPDSNKNQEPEPSLSEKMSEIEKPVKSEPVRRLSVSSSSPDTSSTESDSDSEEPSSSDVSGTESDSDADEKVTPKSPARTVKSDDPATPRGGSDPDQVTTDHSNEPAIPPMELRAPMEHRGSVLEFFNPDSMAMYNTKLSDQQMEEFVQQICSVDRMETFAIRNGDVTDDKLEIIMEALKVRSELKSLNLNCNKIGPKGAVIIAEHLKYFPKLDTLLLHGNPLLDDGVYAIVNGIITKYVKDGVLDDYNNPEFKGIDLGDSEVTNQGAFLVAKLLEENIPIDSLELTGNRKIGVDGWRQIGLSLENNKRLRSLSVDYCDLTDETFKQLVNHLTENKSLKCIDVEGNQLSNVSAMKLKDILYMNKTLNDVTLSPGNEEIDGNLREEVEELAAKNL